MTILQTIIVIVAAAIGGITSGALMSGRWPQYTGRLQIAGFVALAALWVVIFKL